MPVRATLPVLNSEYGASDDAQSEVHSPSNAPPHKKPRYMRGVPTSSTSSALSSLTSSETDPLPPLAPLPLLPLRLQVAVASPASVAIGEGCALGSPGAVADAVRSSFAPEEGSPEDWGETELVNVLTSDIADLCVANEHTSAEPNVSDELKIFFSQYKQPFDLEFYIGRLVQYSNCSTAAFVVALIYLDRVHVACHALSLTEMNCHRLLSTALVLAIKYLDDEVFSNAYYARVSGLTTEELNALEAAMLRILDWRLSVAPTAYAVFEDSLRKSAAILDLDELGQSP